jgi:arginase
VDMGPSAIRYADLDDRLRELGVGCADWGNVETAVAEATASGSPQARFLDQIKATCERIARAVATATREGLTPIVLGGDHSIALGTLGGLASVHGPGAVLWFDAHGDLNTPATTPSGNVHGMPLAAALGLDHDSFASDAWPLPALTPDRVVLIGVRSLDEPERAYVRESGVGVYTMSELDRRGIEPAVREALERVEGAPFVHVSLDMDVVDPDVAPGVGTPVRGGLSYREAHLALELVAESGLLSSFEIVEVNPILDNGNETAALAVELAASAFGARIL